MSTPAASSSNARPDRAPRSQTTTAQTQKASIRTSHMTVVLLTRNTGVSSVMRAAGSGAPPYNSASR